MTQRLEDRVVISGLGRSQSGRRIDRDAMDITMDACLAAIADAGLTPQDIDGLVTWPGDLANPGPYSSPGAQTMQTALRLRLNWFLGSGEGLNPMACLMHACIAVAAGVARHVLVFRTAMEATAQGQGGRRAIVPPPTGAGPMAFQQLYGYMSASTGAALYAQRHFHEYGTGRQHLATVAVTQRQHAMRNENAIFRSPLSYDDYFAARMVSTPLCLFDCDVPADGSFAFVVSTVDHARDTPSMPITFEAMSAARHGQGVWELRDDMTTMALHDAAADMWGRTDMRADAIDVAMLYDGFSFFVLAWLEALGFCGKGESGDFIGDGSRITHGGDLPVNTHGGQLSEGRYVGFGHVYEACMQLRGAAGPRQVEDARVAVVGIGGGNVGQAFLLRRPE